MTTPLTPFVEQAAHDPLSATTMWAVLDFLCRHYNATADSPLHIGNVTAWLDEVGPCYLPATGYWDIPAVVAGLNQLAAPCWDEMCQAVLSK